MKKLAILVQPYSHGWPKEEAHPGEGTLRYDYRLLNSAGYPNSINDHQAGKPSSSNGAAPTHQEIIWVILNGEYFWTEAENWKFELGDIHSWTCLWSSSS
jgi:hypothetical protein